MRWIIEGNRQKRPNGKKKKKKTKSKIFYNFDKIVVFSFV